MQSSSPAPFLRTLCSLRWLATAGQASAIIVASSVLHMQLPLLPLWAGVCVLAMFNAIVQWRLPRRASEPTPATAFGHILVDITILTWMVGFSGGIANPFGSLFVILIALAALALPRTWSFAVAAAAVLGYLTSALAGIELPASSLSPTQLQRWGSAINFLLSSVVVLLFATRLASSLRTREAELAALRERFTRNEGIVALATHAASVAHELNTPLATLTLLIDDLAEQAPSQEWHEDLTTAQLLLGQCRQRVHELAAPAQQHSARATITLEQVIWQWQLVRPTIDLHRNPDAPLQQHVEPAVAHLLMVLLNNAADASLQAGKQRVDLDLELAGQQLHGQVRDYGPGFDPRQAALPGKLFHSSKSDGLGVGLALSHATIERLGGQLWMGQADGPGSSVSFTLPVNYEEAE